MFYQKYMIHLKGGTQVEVEEPYDLPWEKSLFTMYELSLIHISEPTRRS